MKVQEMVFDLSNWHIEVSMLGLSKTEFKMFNIKVHHAGIECITPNIVEKVNNSSKLVRLCHGNELNSM